MRQTVGRRRSVAATVDAIRDRKRWRIEDREQRGKKRRGPAIFRPPGLEKTGTHLLSPTWTTIGPEDFTSEFGMGSGVSPQVSAPALLRATSRPHATRYTLNRVDRDAPYHKCANADLRAVCFIPRLWPAGRQQRFINVVKRSTISTSQLRTSLPLHIWPINLVVYKGSLVRTRRTSTRYLRGGFTLRCFQRLSFRYVATLRCP